MKTKLFSQASPSSSETQCSTIYTELSREKGNKWFVYGAACSGRLLTRQTAECSSATTRGNVCSGRSSMRGPLALKTLPAIVRNRCLEVWIPSLLVVVKQVMVLHPNVTHTVCSQVIIGGGKTLESKTFWHFCQRLPFCSLYGVSTCQTQHTPLSVRHIGLLLVALVNMNGVKEEVGWCSLKSNKVHLRVRVDWGGRTGQTNTELSHSVGWPCETRRQRWISYVKINFKLNKCLIFCQTMSNLILAHLGQVCFPSPKSKLNRKQNPLVIIIPYTVSGTNDHKMSRPLHFFLIVQMSI